VGTGRNTGYIMFSRFWPGVVPEGIVTPIADPTAGAEEYLQFLEDMEAEIWRYRGGDWECVHQAETVMIPNPEPPPDDIPFPEGVGYRAMTTFNGAIYAGVCGFGDLLGIEVPSPLILTSPSGDPGTWQPVNDTGLEGTNTRGMTVHNGKLYVGTSIGDPARAAVFASADPANDGWTKVADFAGTTNTEVIGLKGFNDCLYLTTQGTLDLDTGAVYGFEVWRSTVEDPGEPDVLTGGDWKQIVTEGAGDSRNYWGASMEVLGDYLYVGSISLPIFDGALAQTFKGFELIRVDKDDDWELVIGSYPEFVGIPNSTTAERGIPISGLPAGFGAPLNFYCWSLEEYDGVLYLGTLDLSSLLSCLPVEVLAGTFDLSQQQIAQMQEMIAPFAGADLWKTRDGITWEPASLDGLGNPHNYGFRTMVSGSLYVGTANPYVGQGCQVWAGLPPGPTVTWNFPSTSDVFLAPTPASNRPYLDAAVNLPTGTEPADLSGVYWLDEATGDWQYFIPGFAGSTLTTLEPGENYMVAVSGACSWNLPCGEGAASPTGNMWNFASTSDVFLSPTPANNRPYLDAAVNLPTGTEPADLSGVYWLDEATGEWRYFIPGFAGSTLTSLEPGENYMVAVSGACSWNLPCGEGTGSPTGNTWNFAATSDVFLAPTPANNRPYLDAAVNLPTGTEPADLSGVYWLDEATGDWQYFIPGFAGSTLTTLEPGEAYLVAVSGGCNWQLS
jgi:hypothetical protein